LWSWFWVELHEFSWELAKISN